MKPRNATVVSIGAVIIASAAAVVINTNIFSGTTALADTVAPETSVQSIEALPVPVTPPAPAAALTALTTPAASAAASPLIAPPTQRLVQGCVTAAEVSMLAPQTTTYDVPNIGSVTVSRDGDLLRIDSTTAASGYEAEVKCAAGTGIEVEFDSDGVDYEFRARVLGGQIVTDVSSHNFPQPGVAGAGSPRAERRDHDNDDDHEEEHGDDDDGHHDDDHHEDREEHDDDDD